MAECSDKVQNRGTSNPIQSKIVENDHGSGSSTAPGDNVIENVTCDATVAVGNVVRMNGTTAINALANNTTNSKAIGVCISKTSATECNIQVTGSTTAVFGGLTPSENYFLSSTTPGALTTTPPSASGNVVIHIGRAYTSSQLVLQIGTQVRRS